MNKMEPHHISYQPQPQFIPQQQQQQQLQPQFIPQQQQLQQLQPQFIPQQQQLQQLQPQFIPQQQQLQQLQPQFILQQQQQQQPQQLQPQHQKPQQLHPYQLQGGQHVPVMSGPNFNVANPPPPQNYQQPARPQYGQAPAYAQGTGFVAPRQGNMLRNPGLQQGVPWTTGLFNCFDDPANAIVTTIFPCVTFGQIADVLDNGHTTCMTSAIMYGAAPCLGKPYRRKLRMRFGLGEYPFPDWLVHLLFPFCALCQEYRELKNRGLDPALGYHGNLEKRQRGKTSTTTVPPNNQMMMNMT